MQIEIYVLRKKLQKAMPIGDAKDFNNSHAEIGLGHA